LRRPEAEEGSDHVHWPADIRAGEAVRAEKVPLVVRAIRNGENVGRHRDTGKQQQKIIIIAIIVNIIIAIIIITRRAVGNGRRP